MTQKNTYDTKEWNFYHSTNRQNQAIVLEVQIKITHREKGEDLTGERLERSSGKLVIFCFLVFVLMTQVCLLCENSSNYVLMICLLFYMFVILQLKISK